MLRIPQICIKLHHDTCVSFHDMTIAMGKCGCVYVVVFVLFAVAVFIFILIGVINVIKQQQRRDRDDRDRWDVTNEFLEELRAERGQGIPLLSDKVSLTKRDAGTASHHIHKLGPDYDAFQKIWEVRNELPTNTPINEWILDQVTGTDNLLKHVNR